MITALDICSGGGGELLGLEWAGLQTVAAIEHDPAACETLRWNRPQVPVIEADIRAVDGRAFRGVDVLAGGVPCPPFSIAGKQLGAADERDLFPEALRLIRERKPTAIMLENVPGFASAAFAQYRERLLHDLQQLGYNSTWRILHSSQFGVPQLRPRFVLVALRPRYFAKFRWPEQDTTPSYFVSAAIGDLMATGGWPGIDQWMYVAQSIAPTLVGGSKKHGGPDLGPTRAKQQWESLGINGKGIGDAAPDADFPVDGKPKLTLRMTARIQAFPDAWHFVGGKTAAYRQIGNAFPPPVACAIGSAVAAAFKGRIIGKKLFARMPVQWRIVAGPRRRAAAECT
jgi:DNA (cytosine-5)-methyltransferase 1